MKPPGSSGYRLGVDPRELDTCVSGCASAHQRLLADLDRRLEADELDPHAASLLPDWTVGHVLGHLVGNAEAFTRVMQAAAYGRRGEMYPEGRLGRQQRIDALAVRDAQTLVMTLRQSIWALEAAWAACTGDGWRGDAQGLGTEFPVADVPLRRWREVEVHRSDLGWGYAPEHWDDAYVARELPGFTARWLASNSAAELPDPAWALSPGERLGWLLGRLRPPELPQGLTL